MRYSVLIVLVAFLPSALVFAVRGEERPADKKAKAEKKEADRFEKFDIGPIDDKPPPELDVDPTLEKPAQPAEEEYYSVPAPAESKPAAKALRTDGATHRSEHAVTAALIWLANHQLADGSWSLQNYTQRCIDKSCTGQGTVTSDAGATAMGLLPFLAASQTHKSKGPYKEHIGRGIAWLMRNQQPDGSLAKGAQQMMYSHGLATFALSECYGLTGDKRVGVAAQKAVDYILKAQNQADGGWRYNPGDPGDTSVTAWQVRALKSAHAAGLNVGRSTFAGTSKWLDSVAVHDGAEYAYQPGQGSAPTMTAAGLLCRQYLGAKVDNPMLENGTAYLMKHLPDEAFKNIYYWYYATQVMHNMQNYDWDAWHRKMSDLLVTTQCREDTCAKGSWDPANDAWGKHGGRVMQTSLAVLTLEVVYQKWVRPFRAESEKPTDAKK